MAKAPAVLCRSIIKNYFLVEGWLPRGTTVADWKDITFGAMDIDDPPLAADPHFQKKKISVALQHAYAVAGGALASPLAELKRPTATLGELADWCIRNSKW